MKNLISILAIAAAVTGLAMTKSFADDAAKPAALNFKMKDIDGKEVDLSTYKGNVIMMVNVASKCGNTPQYAALESLYTKYKDKGFVIMGFPANNFGAQEPGTNLQIKEFCTSTYDVKFPMFAKISVKGNDIDPLYKYLTNQDCRPLSKGDVKWNFEKFLVGRDGNLVGRFANNMKPDDKTIVSAIETALDTKQ